MKLRVQYRGRTTSTNHATERNEPQHNVYIYISRHNSTLNRLNCNLNSANFYIVANI